MPDDPAQRQTVRVNLAERSYEVLITSGELSSVAAALDQWKQAHAHLRRQPGQAIIITDKNITQPHAKIVEQSLTDAGWNCTLQELQPGERSKRLEVVAWMYDRLVEMRADRQTIVVAVGGGVVGDAAGYAAATYARGLPLVQVPTTLLAQVDSSVGGKVGVNHAWGKNLIGAFHQPLGVFIDTETLSTLPDREYRAGLAEVVKYGVILDAEFFEYLEANVAGLNSRAPDVLRHVIARSCRLKADVVEQDEYERTGLRAALNYGHTFAHAFEALTGYGQLLHGEAVSVGMLCASRLADRRGLVDASVTARQTALLESLHLPTTLGVSLKAESVLDRMRLDKKSVAGRLRFVLPKSLGHVATFDDVPEDDVRIVLEGFWDLTFEI
ncbi:MAG: 3-dehydroquinate synthase [Planctomycetaceae bacterium]